MYCSNSTMPSTSCRRRSLNRVGEYLFANLIGFAWTLPVIPPATCHMPHDECQSIQLPRPKIIGAKTSEYPKSKLETRWFCRILLRTTVVGTTPHELFPHSNRRPNSVTILGTAAGPCMRPRSQHHRTASIRKRSLQPGGKALPLHLLLYSTFDPNLFFTAFIFPGWLGYTMRIIR
jgi:hypothetical protein